MKGHMLGMLGPDVGGRPGPPGMLGRPPGRPPKPGRRGKLGLGPSISMLKPWSSFISVFRESWACC